MEGGNNMKKRLDKFNERDDHIKEINRKEKEESWSKRRRKMIMDKIGIKRSLFPPKQNNITNYFAPEVPKDEPIMVESCMEEENQEGSGKKTYARVDQHYKRYKTKYKRNVGIVIPGPTTRKTVNSLGASTARRWGTLKPTVGKEKLTGSTGKPRKGVKKKKECSKRKKEEKEQKQKGKNN